MARYSVFSVSSSLPLSSSSPLPCLRSLSTRCQMEANSPSTMLSGTMKLAPFARLSSRSRLMRMRLTWSYSRCICWEISLRRSSRFSNPSFSAKASSITMGFAC